MSAPFIPPGPLEREPRAPVPPEESMAAAREAWRWALRGLPLGAYDRDIADWVVRMWDAPTVLTLASLMERARAGGSGSTGPRVVVLSAGTNPAEAVPYRLRAAVEVAGDRHTVELWHGTWSCTCGRDDCGHVAAVKPLAGQPATQ